MNNFAPVTVPIKTYVTRIAKEGILKKTYDEMLIEYTRSPGFLVMLSSNSKTGKSVLIKKNLDNAVIVTGNDIEQNGLYEAIIAQLDIKIIENTTKNIGGKIAGYEKNEKQIISLKKIVKKEMYNKVLVIDDIQYCSENYKSYLAKEIKNLIEDVITVITTHTEEVLTLVNYNSDLNGRVLNIDIKPWSREELLEILNSGLGNIELEETIKEYIIESSIYNPFILQFIGYNLMSYIGKVDITIEVIDEILFDISLMLQHQIELSLFKPMAKNASKYSIDNKELTFVDLFLYSLTKDPKLVTYTEEEIILKISELVKIDIKQPYKRFVKAYSRKTPIIQIDYNGIKIFDATFILYLKYRYFKNSDS